MRIGVSKEELKFTTEDFLDFRLQRPLIRFNHTIKYCTRKIFQTKT